MSSMLLALAGDAASVRFEAQLAAVSASGPCGEDIPRRRRRSAGWANCIRSCVKALNMTNVPFLFELEIESAFSS